MSENSVEAALYELPQVKCPEWCDKRANHEWTVGVGDLFRQHEAARVEIRHGVVAYVEMLEVAAAEDQWQPRTVDGVRIVVDADGTVTTEEARRLAAALLNAADLLDRIESGS